MRLIDYIHQGGAIMYILVGLNVIGLALIFWKAFEVYKAKQSKDTLADQISNSIKQKYAKVSDNSFMLQVLKEEISSCMQDLEKGLNTVKLIATISPLLGLLGTVIGILLSFRVISQEGLSNHSLFAEGISIALITTVGGLIVAIPHTIGYNYLIGHIDKLESDLEKSATPSVMKEAS